MNRVNGIISFLLVLLVFLIYAQTVRFEYVNYDDQDYVTENKVIQDGLTLKGITWAFSFVENDLTYWHPLAYIAHMADCQIFGVHPGFHHLSNALIHALNVLLLYFVLLTMTGARYQSVFAACLLAVHPISVDSVAWISQKKTLLATFFWLLTLMSYGWYARNPRLKRYGLVCLFAAAGLMTKPVLVTIPMILFIIDFWPLNRVKGFQLVKGTERAYVLESFSLKRLGLEKIPIMGLVVLWGITPFIPDHVTAKNISLDLIPLGLRFKNAFVSYFSYLKKFFMPTDLSLLYPYPDQVPTWMAVLATIGLAAVSYALARLIRKYPYAAVGWAVFTVTLVPFLGFVQGAVWPAYADRFAYVPFIGLYVAFAWGFKEVADGFGLRSGPRLSVAGLIVVALALLAFVQAGVWKDNIRLYTHALNVTKNNYLIHNNLGIAYDEQGRYDEAARQYNYSLAIRPGFSKAHHNLAINLLKRGETDKAIEHFRRSLASNPDNPVAKYNLASIAMERGDVNEAVGLYQAAIKDKPDFSDAHNNLGVLLSKNGMRQEALSHFRAALIADPRNVGALSNLGNELFDMGRLNDARMCFLKALSIEPKNVKVLNDLGVFYAAAGQVKEAEDCFTKVIGIDTGNQTALANLSLLVKEKKQRESRMESARVDWEKSPGDLQKILAYASFCVQNADFKKAETLYLNGLNLDPESLQTLVAISEMYEKSGEYGKAIVYYTRISESHGEKRAEAYYQIACMYALQRRDDEAVKWLQASADSGFSGWTYLRTDFRFDPIRKSKRFQEFLHVVGDQIQ